MKTSRHTFLLATVTCLFGNTNGQSFDTPRFDPPRDSSAAVTSDIRNHDVEGILARALNSDGDTIELSVSASAVRRGKGGEGCLDVTAKRVQGAYELWIEASLMKSVGLDFVSGLAVTGKNGGQATVVLGFDSTKKMSTAIKTLAFLAVLNPAAIRDMLKDELDRLAENSAAVAAARDVMKQAEKLENDASKSLTKLRDEAADALKSFAKLDDEFGKAKKKLQEAKDECDKAWPISEALKKLLDGATSALNVAEKAYDKAKAVKNAAMDARDAGTKTFDRAVSKTRDALEKHKATAEVLSFCEKSVETLREVASSIADLQTSLGVQVRGVAFERSLGLDVEASAKDCGIDLGATRLELEASSLVGVSLRIDFARGQDPMTITVRARHETDVDFRATTSHGIRSIATGLVQIDAVYEVRGVAAPNFSPRRSGSLCKLDLQLSKTIGKDVSLEGGVGRTVAFFVDYATWRRSQNRAGIDLRALTNVPTTVTVQDRIVLGVSGEFERSKNGTDVQVEGDLFWHDRGTESELRGDAGRIAAQMTSNVWLTRQVQQLAASMR
ncbi:MAG: hypothetical protein H6832_16235 [Planctomycetes bacterium]|nr:hypothetical protein [Planctomycetota bacterium]